MERERYPAEWERIATEKKESVGWKCERCGKQCRKPGEPFDTHRNTLTVAHLNHTPEDIRPKNLCAMIPKGTAEIMMRDIQEQREMGERANYASLGDPCDVRTWEQFEAWLYEQLKMQEENENDA